MKSKQFSRFLALAIGLLAAAVASAATKTVAGKVIGRDFSSNTVTVETDTGEQMLFRTMPTTVLKRHDGTVLGLTGIEVGDRVEIVVDAANALPVATQLIVLVPVSGGIVTAPGTDRVNNQTDNTGKASGYRPSQQVPADAD